MNRLPARLPTRAGVLRSRLGSAAVLALILAPAAALAQSAPSTAGLFKERFTAAAAEGPTALLRALSRQLASDPGLVATPEKAAALAQAAAAPVAEFVGAKTPVYREIAQLIVAAAPPDQHAAVERSVGSALATYVRLEVRVTPAPGTLPGAPRAEAADVSAHGYKLGSFSVYPDLQAATFYDDNIYATSHNHVVDWVGTISPRIAIQSNWDRHSLYAEAQTDLTGYWSHSHENTVDWHALLEGQIDVTNNTRILLGGVVLQAHEDRASPDAVEGFEPTPYSEQNAYAGVVHRFENFSLRVGGAVERLTFGNVLGDQGEINNADRDRFRYTFGTLVRYEANPHFRPYVQAMGDIRRYDTVPDDFGFNRNSDGFLVGVGSLFTLGRKVSGEVFVGVLHRSYTDPAFQSLTTPAADATLRWRATDSTAVVLFTERTIDETTLFGSPGYIYTLGGARLEQKLTGKITGIVRAAFAHSDFAQVGRNDNDVDASVGLRYHITPKVTVGVDYRFTQRVSGNTLTDFKRNQVYFRVGTQF